MNLYKFRLRKNFFTIFILLIGIISNSYAQDVNKKMQNNGTGDEILIGLCNRQGLQSGEYGKWFGEEYSYYNYLMERTVLDSLKSVIDSFQIIIIMGTWCDDSREQVPRFYCILDYLKYNVKNLTLYCVDRNKKTMAGETENFNVEKVPTIVVNYKGAEVGRIIERPAKSLEKDMMLIIKRVKLQKGS